MFGYFVQSGVRAPMKVILKEDVVNLGHLGDVKEVAPGYARNFLIPRGLVIAATQKNLAQVEHERRLIEGKLAQRREAVTGVAAQINGTSVSMTVKAGEDSKLFGSVTAKDLISALGEQGIEVDRHAIVLDHPIKSLGDVEVKVDLGHGVNAQLKVSVVAEAAEVPETPEVAEPEG